jgi:hypothetical protein
MELRPYEPQTDSDAMRLGVQPATGLALTCTDLGAPPELLGDPDRVLLLPPPRPDRDF